MNLIFLVLLTLTSTVSAMAENCSNSDLMSYAQANSILSASSESIDERFSGFMSSTQGDKYVFFVADLVSLSGKREIARIECNKETGQKTMSTSTRPGRVIQDNNEVQMAGPTQVLGAMQMERPNRN